MFSPRHFIDQVFSPDFMPDTLVSAKNEFRKQFRKNKDWFVQVKKFCAGKGYTKLEDFKVRIGICLAKTSKKVPPDIKQLSKIVLDVRQKYPVRHPMDLVRELKPPDPGWE